MREILTEKVMQEMPLEVPGIVARGMGVLAIQLEGAGVLPDRERGKDIFNFGGTATLAISQ